MERQPAFMDAKMGHQSSGLLVGQLLHSYHITQNCLLFFLSICSHINFKALQNVTAVESQWKSMLKKYATAVERLNSSGEGLRADMAPEP